MCLSTQVPTQAHSISIGQTEHSKQSFIYFMSREFPNGNFENWAKCEQLLPHVKLLYHMQPSTVELSIIWAQTLTNAGWYLWMTGKYNTAQDFLVKALAVMKLFLNPHDEQMLTTIDIMAGVMSSMGRYRQAEKLHRRALKGFKKRFGTHHSFTLTSMSNLALVLQHQGKYQDAEKMNREALKGSEIVLGACHVDTLVSLSNLALVLQDQGKFEEAVKINLQALKGFQEQLGLQHPTTLTSISNLACVLQSQGNYWESEELNWLVLQRRLKELGVHHPSIQTTVRNLACALRAQDQDTFASFLEQQALKEDKRLQVHHQGRTAAWSQKCGRLERLKEYINARVGRFC